MPNFTWADIPTWKRMPGYYPNRFLDPDRGAQTVERAFLYPQRPYLAGPTRRKPNTLSERRYYSHPHCWDAPFARETQNYRGGASDYPMRRLDVPGSQYGTGTPKMRYPIVSANGFAEELEGQEFTTEYTDRGPVELPYGQHAPGAEKMYSPSHVDLLALPLAGTRMPVLSDRYYRNQ